MDAIDLLCQVLGLSREDVDLERLRELRRQLEDDKPGADSPAAHSPRVAAHR